MAASLSRRGLFRGLRGAPAEAEPEAQAQVARIGEGCVEPRGVACRRCGEACDASAIRFRPMLGGKSAPVLSAEACTGCGDCVSVCPVNAISLVAAERVALVGGLADLARST